MPFHRSEGMLRDTKPLPLLLRVICHPQQDGCFYLVLSEKRVVGHKSFGRYLHRFLLPVHPGCHAAGARPKVNLPVVRRSSAPVAALPAGRSAGIHHSSVFVSGFVQSFSHWAGHIALAVSSHKGPDFSLWMDFYLQIAVFITGRKHSRM